MNILIFEYFEKDYLRNNEIIFNEDKIFSIDLNDMNPELEYDEKIHDLIDRKFNQIMNSHLIIINDSDYEIGFRITHHFRFGYLRKPIFIIGDKPEYKVLAKYPDSSRILSTNGTVYVLEDQLSEKLFQKNIIGLETSLEQLYQDTDSLKAGLLDKVVVKVPEKQGRHSIANQWGAYRMAQVGGLMIEYKFPNTLYFKHLLAQATIPKSIKIDFPSVDKILLIDDNHDRGWEACLKELFGKDKIVPFKSWEDALEKQVSEQIKEDKKVDKFDIILLDLYLGENDRYGTGKQILTEIKKLNQVIPVIMFTASNKAWNMDELYQAGADGYYVKEHPETAHDVEFSIQNFKNFHKTVESCLKKGTLLRKYWRKIKEIENSDLIVNNIGQKNKERINERLTMFLGLLKKAFEQTKFDKGTFLYSEWELAFLTLWSALNEIQETYYVKVPYVFTDKFGNVIESHTRRFGTSKPSMPKISEWSLVLPNNLTPRYSKFIEYDFWFKYDLNDNILDNNGYFDYYLKNKSVLFYDGQSKQKRYYTFNNRGVASVNVQLENILHSQIAFILLNMNAKSPLLENLKELNEKRNHLYLTHGEDSKDEDFSKKYQEQRKGINWEENIEQLFEIVYFLCTGKECDWNN